MAAFERRTIAKNQSTHTRANLAHALGTLVGAFVAASIAASHKMAFALGIGVFFLLGGIWMIVEYGGPLWYCVLDLVGAYLPMGYLGGVLAGGKKSA